NGGAWGTAGSTGGTGTSDAVGFAQGSLGGGAAGRAIRAINGATVSLTGAKSAATLESEGRLLGGILVE
ncbi:MAG: hypothetical protein V2I24_15575, partial [Halieaceae bacterium]|nr:hypothetical protein [Halieaceae bacterium]